MGGRGSGIAYVLFFKQNVICKNVIDCGLICLYLIFKVKFLWLNTDLHFINFCPYKMLFIV